MKKLFLALSLIIFLFISCESEKFTTFDGNELEVSSLIGKNVFDIVDEYSRSSPETLKGTNNNRWVVYYKDIDVTFVTNKTTNTVKEAEKGKNPR